MPCITLEIRTPHRAPELRHFTLSTITIGREQGHVVLGDPQASARHGEIHVASTQVTYVDLGSSNGSYLGDGQRIVHPTALVPGSVVRIGSSSLSLVSAELGTATAAALADDIPPPSGAAVRALAAHESQPPPGVGYPLPGALPPPSGFPHVPFSPSSAAPDPIKFTQECIAAYRPHWVEATKVVGVVALPLGLVSALGGIPLIGWLFSFVGSLGYLVAFLFFGLGAQAEYAMRLAAGRPVTAAVAWRIQLGRMVPWTLGILVPLLISTVGCVVTLVLFGLFLLPVYMLEQQKMFDVNKRSMELASKNWALAIVPPLLIIVPVVIVNAVASVVLGVVPFLGGALVALWSSLFSAAVTPLVSFVQFRVYFQLRREHEGVDAANAMP